jgi:hypothetical protein
MKRTIKILHHLYETEDIAKIYREINSIKDSIKNVHPAMQKAMRESIKSRRRDLKDNYGFSSFEVVVTHKNKVVSEEYPNWPTAKDIKSLLDNMYRDIRTKRKEQKKMKVTKKEVMGLEYETVGGVFTKPVSKLITKESIVAIINNHKSPHPKMKDNYVGIELECIVQAKKEDLNKAFLAAKLQSNVHVGTDGSLRSDERGGNCYEVRVLVKESDLVNVVTKVTDILKKHGGYVNNSCGMHVHLDMRHRDVATSYERLFKSRSLLQNMVSNDRLTNNYCRPNMNASYVEEISKTEKYRQFNLLTYDRIKTLEVRMHGGSVTASKIINWVKLLTYIVDNQAELGFVDSSNVSVAFPNMTTKMLGYIEKRTADVKKSVDVKLDETTFIQYEMAV